MNFISFIEQFFKEKPKVAYVDSKDGNDFIAIVGNPKKPFKTIKIAIQASRKNGIIYVKRFY
jgi:hypothetical protein